MKYLLMPIIKFIWAIIFSIMLIIVLVPICLFYILWEFKLPDLTDEFTSFNYRKGNTSPYFKPDPFKMTGKYKYIFKTPIHYIWNINPKLVEI